MKTMNLSQDKETLWHSLKEAAQVMQQTQLSSLFASDPKRAQNFSLALEDLYLDYSKNFLTPEILAHLMELAHRSDVPAAIQRLMTGEAVNSTEKRPALHTALRQNPQRPVWVNGVNVIPEILSEKEKMYHMVDTLWQKKWLGVTGLPITDVVNIGIGGSDLGPVMAVEALKPYQGSHINLHFVSNIDPIVITDVVAKLNPATTLFIISSKSFSTPETLTNAAFARIWLEEKLGTQKLAPHFIAVTANPTKAIEFGVAPNHILQFGPWVGGRYSIWSTIGFPLALSIGIEHFEAFLAGARKMDEHFAQADLTENMPVLLALIGIWYSNFWHASTIAILPYTQHLRYLPDYLQQLDMESNGKRTHHDGRVVAHTTGPIVWGHVGTNGQHAFYQLLHQGTHFVPIDFIALAHSHTTLKDQHLQLLANCFAQSAALMTGNQDVPFAHDYMPGNKPSNTLLLTKMTPHVLGQLLALYEHKIFVQGIIWDINSFDQPGVELGKKLAHTLFKYLVAEEGEAPFDASTNALMEKARQNSLV